MTGAPPPRCPRCSEHRGQHLPTRLLPLLASHIIETPLFTHCGKLERKVATVTLDRSWIWWTGVSHCNAVTETLSPSRQLAPPQLVVSVVHLHRVQRQNAPREHSACAKCAKWLTCTAATCSRCRPSAPCLIPAKCAEGTLGLCKVADTRGALCKSG